jgi:hypothetical protein
MEREQKASRHRGVGLEEVATGKPSAGDGSSGPQGLRGSNGSVCGCATHAAFFAGSGGRSCSLPLKVVAAITVVAQLPSDASHSFQDGEVSHVESNSPLLFTGRQPSEAKS